MTPQEKATEIAMCNFPMHETADAESMRMGALQMAEWKDKQFKEALNNILIECDACFDEQTTNTLESIIKHQIEI